MGLGGDVSMPPPPPPLIDFEGEQARLEEAERRRLIGSAAEGRTGTLLGGSKNLVEEARQGGLISRERSTTLG